MNRVMKQIDAEKKMAADLDALRAENAKLREALQSIADLMMMHMPAPDAANYAIETARAALA